MAVSVKSELSQREVTSAPKQKTKDDLWLCDHGTQLVLEPKTFWKTVYLAKHVRRLNLTTPGDATAVNTIYINVIQVY